MSNEGLSLAEKRSKITELRATHGFSAVTSKAKSVNDGSCPDITEASWLIMS